MRKTSQYMCFTASFSASRCSKLFNKLWNAWFTAYFSASKCAILHSSILQSSVLQISIVQSWMLQKTVQPSKALSSTDQETSTPFLCSYLHTCLTKQSYKTHETQSYKLSLTELGPPKIMKPPQHMWTAFPFSFIAYIYIYAHSYGVLRSRNCMYLHSCAESRAASNAFLNLV